MMIDTCRPSKPKIVITAIYMLFMLTTSLIPMDRQVYGLNFIIEFKSYIQNILHIPLYAVLSILFLQLFKNYYPNISKRIVLIFVCCGGFGILNEIIQSVIPGRYGGVGDIILNLIGAMIGILIFTFVERRQPGLLRRIICE